MTGKTLAHYELQEKIGEGGMGAVYRARDTQLGRDVAIKILPELFSADPDRLQRFEREARLLASLNHSGIAIIHGLHTDGETRFLAMELVPGADLSARISIGAVPVDEALPILQQLAEALAVAHDQGIVHRDLKPSNVMLTPDDRVKVLDFGLAKSIEATSLDPRVSQSPTMLSAATMQGVILGTAAYMSPEQSRGKTVDKRTDIWAFGVIAFEMLTGKQLFLGETVSDTLAEVLKSEIPWASLPADLPPALVSLLRRCLDRNPTTRLQDMGEARIVLARISAGDVGERVATVTQPNFLARWGGWIAAAVVVVASLVMMSLRGTPAVQQAQDDVPLRKWILPMSREDASLGDGFAPAISRDGRYLAYESNNQIWVRDFTTIDARPLAGTEGGILPSWSPDGKWLAFATENKIRKIAREGGTVSLLGTTTSADQPDAASGAMVWTEDGRIIVGTGNAGLMGLAAQGGEVKEALATSPGISDYHEVVPLPQGKGFLAVAHDTTGYGTLVLWTADSTRTRIMDIEDNINSVAFAPSGHILYEKTGDSHGVWAQTFSLESMTCVGEPFLVAAGGSHPTVSDDGTLVYTTGRSDLTGQMVLVNRDGKILQELGPKERVSRPFPEFSPDDQFVLHSATIGDSREVFRYDLQTLNRQRLTFNETFEGAVAFIPGSDDFLYYEEPVYKVMRQSLSGGSPPVEICPGIFPTTSRDGSTLVYCKQGDGFVFSIATRDLNDPTAEPNIVVSTGGVDFMPQLSPNERFIAYTSDESGHEEVYVTTFPKASARWLISQNGGSFPRWREDGKELFFTTRTTIETVTVNTEGSFSFSEPRALFTRPSVDWSSRWFDGYDVSADGERFVMFNAVHSGNEGEVQMVVVQNWFREFQTN